MKSDEAIAIADGFFSQAHECSHALYKSGQGTRDAGVILYWTGKAWESAAKKLCELECRDSEACGCASRLELRARVTELEAENAAQDKAIEAVRQVLNNLLGDTDPNIPEEWTPEDIKREEPLLWCHQQLLATNGKGASTPSVTMTSDE